MPKAKCFWHFYVHGTMEKYLKRERVLLTKRGKGISPLRCLMGKFWWQVMRCKTQFILLFETIHFPTSLSKI